MKIKFFTLLLLTVFFVSCSDDDTNDTGNNNPLTGFAKVQEFTDGDTTFELYTATGDLVQGYNTIKLKVKSGDNYIDNADLSWEPMMHMETMTHNHMRSEDMMMHSCPNSSITNEGEGVYSGYIVFQMPTVDGGTWNLNISANIDGEDIVIQDKITVQAQEYTTSKQFEAGNGKVYVLALIAPENLGVGVNKIQVTLHERTSMMSFPVVKNYTFALEPRMPDMMHGSPNNEDFTYDASTHNYYGKVNLTMTGRWMLHLKLSDDMDNLIEGSDIVDEKSDLYLEFAF